MIDAGSLAVGAIVATGAVLQGAVGIGFTVLAAPLLLLLAPELVPGPILMLGVLVAGMTATREFRAVDVRELGLAMSGRIAAAQAAATPWLVPPVLPGFLASRDLVRPVDKSRGGIKTLVLAISAFSAAVLLVRPPL